MLASNSGCNRCSGSGVAPAEVVPMAAPGTLSAAGKRSLTVKPYRGGEAAEPQTLTVKARPYIYGGKYC